MHTEDDTYDALRRIPLAELERRFESTLNHLEFLHEHYVQETKKTEDEIKKQEWRYKYRWIFGSPDWMAPRLNMFSSAYIACLESMRINGTLDGTGWSIDDYIDVLDKRMAEATMLKKSNKRKVTATGAVVMIPVCISTVVISRVFEPPWYINYTFDITLGIFAGIMLSKFARWKKWD